MSTRPYIHIIITYGDGVEDLQRRKMIHHVFCLEGVVGIKLSEQTLPLKIYDESDIPCSQSDSIAG